jgi:hypothetical protein
MRTDKKEAFNLRKTGLSYRDIQKRLGVSRSTLCDWFKNVEWSKHIKLKNTEKSSCLNKEKLLLMQKSRVLKLNTLYEDTEKIATEQFNRFKTEPLFIAGLMIYAGEGDKRSPNNSRISNSDFYIHKVFIKFSEKYLDIPRENVKISLIIYPDLDINSCVNKWSDELKIPKQNFYKTQIIQGKDRKHKLLNGTGMSIISSRVVVKKRILKWLELVSFYDFI